MKTVVWALVALLAAAPAQAARLFTSGFELQSATNGIEWYTSDGPPTAGTISTTTVRSGAAAMCVTNPASTVETGINTRFLPGGDGIDYIARAYINLDTLPDAATAILGLGTGAQAVAGRVVLNTDGTLTARFDSGGSLESVGPGATTLMTDTWYRIELRVKRHGATPNAGADEGEVRIDGVSELSSTSLSIATGPSRLLVGANLLDDTATVLSVCFDDVALNDSQGTSQTSWPGAGSVVTLFPNGNGEFEQTITLNSATCASAPEATTWESVDDGAATGTVDGEDCATLTDSVANWTSLGSRVAVAMGDLPGFADSVALVTFGVRVRVESAANATYAISAQKADGGTKAPDDSTLIATTSFVLNDAGVVRAASPLTLYVDPDSAAWTTSTINSLQMLIRGADADPDIHVTSMWATVEYTPGEAPTPSGCQGLALLGVGC